MVPRYGGQQKWALMLVAAIRLCPGRCHSAKGCNIRQDRPDRPCKSSNLRSTREAFHGRRIASIRSKALGPSIDRQPLRSPLVCSDQHRRNANDKSDNLDRDCVDYDCAEHWHSTF